MTTIDHAAEARKALEAAIETPADIGPAADPWLLAAQVHATLALVNEQRIANVLAYLEHAEGDEYEHLRTGIKKGLGL